MLPRPAAPVLVVEDDAGIRHAVASTLRLEGYAVREAADGLEGLTAVREEAPCVILLDMKMPVMDGWHFVALYRRMLIPHAPIVVMTAAADAARWAAEVGADCVLAKPFALTELLATVERCRASESQGAAPAS